MKYKLWSDVLMISAVWKIYVALGEEYANDNLGVGDPPQYFIMFEFTGACFQINRSCQRHDRLSTAWVQFMQLFWQTLLMWYTGLPVWHGPKLCDLKAQVTCSSSRTQLGWYSERLCELYPISTKLVESGHVFESGKDWPTKWERLVGW